MAVPKFDVLGLGCAAVDDLIYVDSYPPADAKVSVLRTDRQCGGLTATALVAASRLGSRCAYAGVLGTDEYSQFGIDRMLEQGIDLAHLVRRPEARIIHSFIVVDVRSNTRNIFADLNGVMGCDPNWPASEIIESSRVLFVDHFGLPGMIRASRIARENGVPIVADFERASGPEFSELLELVDHLIVSQTFAENLTGKSSPSDAARALGSNDRAAVVVTCGEKGCWYLAGKTGLPPKHFPAFAVKTVDTTGCGDVFHGAYASALARGLNLDERVRFASATAALKATQPGGQAGIPNFEQVQRFLQNSKV